MLRALPSLEILARKHLLRHLLCILSKNYFLLRWSLDRLLRSWQCALHHAMSVVALHDLYFTLLGVVVLASDLLFGLPLLKFLIVLVVVILL